MIRDRVELHKSVQSDFRLCGMDPGALLSQVGPTSEGGAWGMGGELGDPSVCLSGSACKKK